MPDFKTLFTGRFLASPDLGKNEVTVKIESVTSEAVRDDEKGTERKRWILYFEGKDKGMLLNKTNALLIAALCRSSMTEDWIGHSITVGVRRVQLGPEMVDGLRVIGSPELTAPLDVPIKMPRKKARTETLAPTGKAQSKSPPPPADQGGDL